jgi:mono/diheme cytochrome c family protein
LIRPTVRAVLLTSLCAVLSLIVACAGAPKKHAGAPFKDVVRANVDKMFADGQQIFRFDTFGDEAFWGGKLHLHEPIAGEKHGGTGPGLTPKQALAVGLKVDTDQLPAPVVALLKAKKVDFDDPKYTILLLQHDAVVGVKAFWDDKKQNITSIGLTCGFCHSTVDDAIQPGVGRRLDGWPNRDLNVGAIVLLAPNPQPVADMLGVDLATVKKVLQSWGPGKYDAELNFDGKGMRPDGKSAAVLIPPAFGLLGFSNHTWSGSRGTLPYWNSYVAVTQMHGSGTFIDPRLNTPENPVAVKNGFAEMRGNPDNVTSKLAALQYYQLSIPPPTAPPGSYNVQAAQTGQQLFQGKAKCATCHVPPLFTEPGWNLHTAQEIGVDDFQASRSPGEKAYRTAPLRGLFAHARGGFYHDGRFATLNDVVEHYDQHLKLGLSGQEKAALVEYLKSL